MTDRQDNFYEIVHDFDEFMNDQIMRPDITVRVSDLTLIIISCVTRLRAELTLDELRDHMSNIIKGTEESLQEGTALLDPITGESANMVLAEERDAMKELTPIPDTVPEDWV